MWRKTVTTKGTYIEQAHSEECMCRVRETAEFIGSLISEYKIENSSISGNAMKERLRQKKIAASLELQGRVWKTQLFLYTLNKYLNLENSTHSAQKVLC